MPFVHVELLSGRTIEQKNACAKALVAVLQEHLGARPEATRIIFVDVEKTNWLVGDKIP